MPGIQTKPGPRGAHPSAVEDPEGAPARAFDGSPHCDLPTDLQADFAPLPGPGHDRAAFERPVDPFRDDSVQAQEAFDAAVAAAAEGDEEAAIQQYLHAAKFAESAREWYLAAVACQRVGDYFLEPNPPFDVERAFRMHRRAVAAYEECGLFSEARELAYRQMYLKMRHGSGLHLPVTHRVELFLHWAIAGFGYRPLRVVMAAVAVVLIYGIAYWALGGVVSAHSSAASDLWHSIYFSGITFATVGYGDFYPAPHVRMLALSEGFLGAFTLGLFVAVLANRLNKA